MIVLYDNPWRLLANNKMSKAALQKTSRFMPNIITRLSRTTVVTMGILAKKCDMLDYDYGVIMEHVKKQNRISIPEEAVNNG